LKKDIQILLKSFNIDFYIDGDYIVLNQLSFAFLCVEKNNDFSPQNLIDFRDRIKQKHHKFLIFIWWDLWQNRKEIIKSKIRHQIGLSEKIHARKTTVRVIEKEIALEFQKHNHLMMPLPGYKHLGLFLDNQLIALAIFAKKRKFRDDSYSAELLRFCTLNHSHINGGLSKLIKAFTLKHPIDSLMTYIDLDWADGSNFEKIGFEIIDEQPPMFFKIVDGQRILSLQKDYDVFNLGSLKLMNYF